MMQTYGAIGEDALPDKARRRFLTAGALLIGFAFARPLRAFEREPDLAAIGALDAAATGFDGFVPDGFIRIGVDGRIVLVVPSVEMGQGIATGEAMMIAEELEVGLDQVEVALAPADLHAFTQNLLKAQATGGSTSVRAFFIPLRQAGAAARTMLIGAAAERWRVPPAECVVARGVITHQRTGRTLTYGAVASAARRQPMPGEVSLKPVSQFKLIGKPAKRVDTAAKVNGIARFGIDTMVEGMRVAAIAMCPTIGGRLRSLDERASHALPGVVDILRIDDAVAVVGENYWTAKRGLDLLKIEWDEGPHAALTSATLAESLRSAQGTPINGSLTGDPDRVIQEAGKQRIEATYGLPYLAQTVAGRIRGPVGLDIGAKTPAGIALAIVAQIHAVLGLREGSPIEVATC